VTNWQPIETAPKDGTVLRLKRVYNGAVIADGRGYFGSATIHYAIEDGGPATFHLIWAAEDGRHFFPMPTHWAPVAPQEEEPRVEK
jgi:hypothetical protein